MIAGDERDAIYAAERRHLQSFFAGHACQEHQWKLGPAIEVLPRLRVFEFAPGYELKDIWIYATVGAWESRLERPLEFLITAPSPHLRHVELLTMSAWYHRDQGLGLVHTFPLGDPWLPGSACEFMLVSLPYPFGQGLEICELPHESLHYLWLLPITEAARAFKVREDRKHWNKGSMPAG